jgi:predicted small lipoprotein YifL
MKKMKRLVAVLLAGIMVLAMLTACGGGLSTPTSDVEKAEALYMDAFNTALGTNYENNNTELKDQAKQVLDTNLNDDGTLKSDGKMTVTTKKDGKLLTVVTILAQKNAPYGITSEELANKDKVIVNVDDTTKKITTGLAVGAVKKGDKIYVAIAMTKDMNLMK